MRVWAYIVPTMLFLCIVLSPIKAGAAAYISDPILSIDPESPEPYSEATLSITNPYSIPTGSTVQWFIDGVEYTNYQNDRSITLTTKASGETTDVQLLITQSNGVQRNITANIAPVRIDLIVTANSHTPTFYKGRSLPARGSEMSAQAYIFDDDSGPYTYHWRVNNESVYNKVGESNGQIQFAPKLNSGMTVEVSIHGNSGELVGRKTVDVPLVAPEILFYETNSLRGLIPKVLQSPYLFLNEEITLRGEPYYFFGDLNDLSIKWSVDGTQIESDEMPLELTLIKTKEAGRANIGLKVIDTESYLESAENSLSITY